jgi:two-component system, NarL family, nitrate/nitrite response regulator NarL
VLGARRVSVLIADETSMGCELLRSALTRSRFLFRVEASVIHLSDVIHSVEKHAVDVCLVSENLAEGPFMGFKAVSELRVSFPDMRVILLVKSSANDSIVNAFRAGAKGVFCRTEPIEALCRCIQAVHAGQIWANSRELNLLVEAFAHLSPLSAGIPKQRPLLAKREVEVADLVAEGLTNRDIARRLGLSEHTIGNYLFRIYEKIGISSRVELVLHVLRQRHRE